MEQKRRKTNKAIRKSCMTNDIIFLESWACVQKGTKKGNKTANLDCFADDGLHLNNQGIVAFARYLECNSIRCLHLKKVAKKETKPK
jgi:hypothetical protein